MGMLAGMAAIVTGGGQGVGRGIALALAAEGARVAVAGRTLAKCEATVAEITDEGGDGLALACDIGSRAEVKAMVANVAAHWGGLGLLVNNAHTSRPLTALADTSDADMALAFTGFHGAFFAMQAALPHLCAAKGSVINLGSVAGMRGDAGFGAYAAAKEAVRAMSRTAAREWGPLGVRVNVLCPFSDSPGVDYMIRKNPGFIDTLTAETALGRLGDSREDVGRTAVFLASSAGAYITGQTINVDGGIWIAP